MRAIGAPLHSCSRDRDSGIRLRPAERDFGATRKRAAQLRSPVRENGDLPPVPDPLSHESGYGSERARPLCGRFSCLGRNGSLPACKLRSACCGRAESTVGTEPDPPESQTNAGVFDGGTTSACPPAAGVGRGSFRNRNYVACNVGSGSPPTTRRHSPSRGGRMLRPRACRSAFSARPSSSRGSRGRR